MSSCSIKYNFYYKSLLTVSSYLINIIIFPYISRVLGVNHIGLVSFVDNTVNIFILFASLGINVLGVREIAAVKENYEGRSKVFANLFGINLFFTSVIILIYFFSIWMIPSFHQESQLFYIGIAKIIATTFLVEWFYNGIEDFKYITIRSIIIKVLYVCAVFFFIRTPADYLLYFILTISVVVFNALLNIIHIRHYIKWIYKEISFINTFFRQNLILGFYSILTSLYLTFNVTFLGIVSNNTEVGLYVTSFKLYSVIIGLFSAFTSVMLLSMIK